MLSGNACIWPRERRERCCCSSSHALRALGLIVNIAISFPGSSEWGCQHRARAWMSGLWRKTRHYSNYNVCLLRPLKLRHAENAEAKISLVIRAFIWKIVGSFFDDSSTEEHGRAWKTFLAFRGPFAVVKTIKGIKYVLPEAWTLFTVKYGNKTCQNCLKTVVIETAISAVVNKTMCYNFNTF